MGKRSKHIKIVARKVEARSGKTGRAAKKQARSIISDRKSGQAKVNKVAAKVSKRSRQPNSLKYPITKRSPAA